MNPKTLKLIEEKCDIKNTWTPKEQIICQPMREGQQNLKAKDFQKTSGTKNIQAIQGGYPLAKAQYFLLSA